jgi:hypothetical protein
MLTTAATAQDIVVRSLRSAGILGGAEMPSAEDAEDVLTILNGMVDAWTMDNLYIYNYAIDVYALTPNQQTYDIGPTATAPFDVPRPSEVVSANLVFTTQSPPTRVPLILLDDDGWMTIPVRGVSGTPVQLYYSRSYPNGQLNFWPIPSQVFSVELETWSQLSQFTDLTTAFSFPPGYFEAMYLNLAIRLCTPEWGINDVPSSLRTLANEARSRIQALNQNPPPQMNPDYGTQGVKQQSGYRNLYNPAPIWTRQ